MSATTISRTAYNLLVDDSGDKISGSVWDKADVNDILNAIDALFASTTGITLNQGGGDGAILTFESSDVGQGMTDFASTQTYGNFTKKSPTEGGLEIRGFRANSVEALKLAGFCEADDTTKSTAATAVVEIVGVKRSGSGVAALGANANILAVMTSGTTRFILDSDGDSHQDVGTSWTNYDDYPDVELLHALSAGVSRTGDPLRREFGKLLAKHRPALERARIVTFNTDGHHFVNWSRVHMLVIGAVRQQAAALAKTQRQVRGLQKKLKAA